jgi:hypothetical protein
MSPKSSLHGKGTVLLSTHGDDDIEGDCSGGRQVGSTVAIVMDLTLSAA